MKKRILSILLSIIMLLGMLPVTALPAFAEETYPIVINSDATYSDMTFDLSGKTVEHIFEITGKGLVTFQNITFINVSGTGDGSCVYINSNQRVKVSFRNCRFINCSASGNGGAVYVKNTGTGINYNSFVIFSDCYAVNCRAGDDGGFMCVNDADVNVYGEKYLNKDIDGVPQHSGEPSTVISGCTAGNNGGGIYMNYGKVLEGFLLSDNTATTGDGGGICNTSNSATVSNCRFYRNTCGGDGGGLYTDKATVENCKFFENDCSDDGYELSTNSGSTQINNCTFTSKYSGDNVVYGGMQSNCTFPDKSSYQLTVGDGSQENPYVIKTIDDWDALHYMALKRERVIYSDGTEKVFNDDYSLYGKYIRLDADITVCNTVGEVHDYAALGGAVLYTSYSEFNGIFDGNGHAVTYVSCIGSDRNGVFGYANSATVKNLTVNGYVGGRSRVGGLFGSTYNCTAENCTNNATVYGTISSLGDTASCIGGIAGHSECSSYAYCINNGKIEGMHEHIGGIVGYSNGDTVNACINNGAVVGFQKCGGIVGTAHETDSLINGEHRTPKILNCINNADVTANYNYAGGLIGYEESAVTVENCIVNGTVSAKSYADAITGNSAAGSKYEGIYYNKAKATGTFGIGLSENAMRGVSADIIDEKEYIMPNILNDDIIENAPGTQNYLPVYFDDNNILTIAHSIDENSLTLGESGKTSGYYATKNETVFNDRVCVKGNVLLFLRDGSTLKANKGITLENGNTLTVYGSEDTEKAGKLIATAETNSGNAGIGGIRGKDGAGYPNGTCDSGTPGTSAGTLRVYGGYICVSGTVGFGGGLGGNAYPGEPVLFSGSGGDGGSGGILELFGGNFEAFGTDCAVGGGKGGYASGGGSKISDFGTTTGGNTGTPTVISYEPNIVLYAGEKTASEIVSNGKMCQDKKYFKTINTKALAVDCVSAIGGGYIDTTYQPNENTRVVMDVDVRGSSEYWFGVWDENYNKKAFALGNDGGGVYAGYGNQGGTDTAGAVPNGRHTVELNKNKVYIDGEERTSVEFTDSSEGLPTQNSLYLFAQNRNGSPVNTGVVICYGCKIYENDKLIHEYIPMKDTVSGVGFLYDTVGKNSFRGKNGNIFVGTPEENILFAEYATVGGNAHFETDVNTHNYNKRVVMDVYVNDQSEDWFGCSGKYYEGPYLVSPYFRVSNRSNGVTVTHGSNAPIVVTSGALPNGRHTIDFNLGNLYIDGIYKTFVQGPGPLNQPLCLFANIHNNNGEKELQKSNPVTFYSCQIYDDDGNLLHDYAPAVIGLTGESVLYDFVTGRVYSYNGDTSKVTSYNLSEHSWRNLEANKAGTSTLMTEAGCGSDAVYYKVCADCDIISTTETWTKIGSATGNHTWIEAEQNKAGTSTLKTKATCGADEVYYKVCSVCDEISTTETWTKSGTATGDHKWQPYGDTQHKCSACNETEDHTFVNGECVCGEKEKTVLYTVTFDMQGHGTEIVSQEIAPDGKVQKPADPTAEGYKFGGWYKEADCVNPWSFETDTITADTTLYAKWTKIYTVTFDLGDYGTGEVPSQIVENGGKVTKPESDPTDESRIFGGWYADAECTDKWDFDKYTISGDTTLYAKWIVGSCTLWLYLGDEDGTRIKLRSAHYGQPMPKVEPPTRDGLVFLGYYDIGEMGAPSVKYYNADGTSARNWDKETATATLVAHWAAGTLPPAHEHTFSDKYSMDETYHWYAATCEHTDLIKGMEKHTFGDGVTVGNKTTYTCTACGYEKVVTAPHEHTYGEATYIWNEDLTKCTAIKTCECGNAVIETVDAVKGENNTIKATFTTDGFTEQTKKVTEVEDEAAKALAEAKTAAKAVIDNAVKDTDNDIKNYGETAKGDIDKLTTITAVTEKLEAALAEINGMKTQKAITAALSELEKAVSGAVATKSKAIAKAAKPLIENAESADEANAVLADALNKIASEEKTLSTAKIAAKQAVSQSAGEKQSKEMQAIVEETEKKINDSKSLEEVEKAKQEGLKAIEAQKQAEKPTEPENPEVCPKCGGTHADNFFGKIACFFNRVINWFKNLFK